MKKILAVLIAATLTLSIAGCGGGNADSAASSTNGGGTSDSSVDAGPSESEAETTDVTIDQLTLGEDYTDLTADLRFITHRTDIVDTVFQEYITSFQQLYPNISITYESITDYATDMITRLSTPDWGDICMIPAAVPKTETSNYFAPLGSVSDLEGTYNFMNERSYQGTVYGIPSTINVSGVLYNKSVFEQAGITELPKTPDAFLETLQTIKDKTDAIPMYTNFAAGWTMTAWDAYIGGSATGNPDFMNIDLPHAKDPFANRGDGAGPYAVYTVLYEAVSRGLTEDDPTTTDWEGSKGMLNNGQIATMVLGSWSIVQMQQAGENADDIGYMSFPITVDGKQYASSAPDFCYGINKNSDSEKKLAAMLYIKWLVEKSNFDFDQGGIPVVKGHDYPDTLSAFDGIELVSNSPAREGEEDLFSDINNDSEVGVNSNQQTKAEIVEAAFSGSKTLDNIMADWNQRWTASQEKYNVTPE